MPICAGEREKKNTHTNTKAKCLYVGGRCAHTLADHAPLLTLCPAQYLMVHLFQNVHKSIVCERRPEGSSCCLKQYAVYHSAKRDSSDAWLILRCGACVM